MDRTSWEQSVSHIFYVGKRAPGNKSKHIEQEEIDCLSQKKTSPQSTSGIDGGCEFKPRKSFKKFTCWTLPSLWQQWNQAVNCRIGWREIYVTLWKSIYLSLGVICGSLRMKPLVYQHQSQVLCQPYPLDSFQPGVTVFEWNVTDTHWKPKSVPKRGEILDMQKPGGVKRRKLSKILSSGRCVKNGVRSSCLSAYSFDGILYWWPAQRMTMA